VETEIKFSVWSCLSYVFAVEGDSGNATNEMFLDVKHSVAQFLSLFFLTCFAPLLCNLVIDVVFSSSLAEGGREFFWSVHL